MTVHGVVATLKASPNEPMKVLVQGGIGTGKTTLITAVRAVLRDASVTVIPRSPGDGDPGHPAIVVDDAHLLEQAELRRLVGVVDDPKATVVIAAEPLTHDDGLAALSVAMARQSPVVTLGPLLPAEIARAAAEALRSAPPPELVRTLATATAGLPFLVAAAIADTAAPDSRDPSTTAAAITQATRNALIDRLRRVEDAVADALLISSLSPELGPDDVAAALRLNGTEAHRLVDHARASGLLAPSHGNGFQRTLHRCLAQIVGTARHREIEIELLRSQTENQSMSTDLALRMADHGLRDARLADALTDLAERSDGQPGRAARLYRAATEVGATNPDARLADALAAAGDCSTAGRLADQLLTSEDPAERAAAVRIAASVAVHDGGAAAAAELFDWLGPYPDAVIGAANAVVAIGVGDAATARAAAETDASGPPTATARSARSLSEGLLHTLDSAYPLAMTRLSQAIPPELPSTGVAPDTAVALVTLAALHGGDPVRARSVVSRAVRAAGDDAGFAGHRHRLLLGWIRMLDGQLATAGADVAAVAGATLHRRDALWAAALQTAIARRSGDSGGVQKHWYAAMEILTEYSVDLYSLLPLGELWIAGARMRQVDRLTHTLDEAFGLLEALGNPTLWSLPFRWAGVHAGIQANSPESVAPHGQALTAAAGHSAFAKSLATAGRTWLRVLANEVDVDEVTVAARSLAQFGLGWDATRLASQAALQTPDGRISAAMLQLARDLKVAVTAQDEQDATPAAVAAAAPPPSSMPTWSRLSDREREVAELVLQGMPYRDIGSQLLISAKTVEHHVARIRRRLGAESRSELMSMLRAILGVPS